jgi:hypothetical protein
MHQHNSSDSGAGAPSVWWSRSLVVAPAPVQTWCSTAVAYFSNSILYKFKLQEIRIKNVLTLIFTFACFKQVGLVYSREEAGAAGATSKLFPRVEAGAASKWCGSATMCLSTVPVCSFCRINCQSELPPRLVYVEIANKRCESTVPLES